MTPAPQVTPTPEPNPVADPSARVHFRFGQRRQGPHLRAEDGWFRPMLGLQRGWSGDASPGEVRFRQRLGDAYVRGEGRWPGSLLGVERRGPEGRPRRCSCGGERGAVPFLWTPARRDPSECWGSDGYGQSSPPTGEFTALTAGQYHSCALSVDGSVQCWGSNSGYSDEYRGQAVPPAGEFIALSAGSISTCGIRKDQTLACWGLALSACRRGNGRGTGHPGAGLEDL